MLVSILPSGSLQRCCLAGLRLLLCLPFVVSEFFLAGASLLALLVLLELLLLLARDLAKVMLVRPIDAKASPHIRSFFITSPVSFSLGSGEPQR